VAVKVKLEKKKKAVPVRFAAADFAHPDERRARLIGIGIGAGAVLAILGLVALTPIRLQLMPAWVAWALIALAYYGVGLERQELQQAVRPGPDRQRAAPSELTDIVNKQARLVGVVAQAALAAEGAELRTVRNTVIVPEQLVARLTPGERWALVGREMGHIKAGHVGLGGLCRRVVREGRVLGRGLRLPLVPLVRGLGNWRWLAELSADRMALVLTRDRKVLAAALLKQAIAGEEGITAAEIDEYLSRQGGLTAQSAEVTTHFRLGEVLREREDLMFRLRAIAQYAEAEEYRRACERLDTGQRKAQEAQPGQKPTGGGE
jgi:Zn-dependent protease with chaperone function